jgi:2-polyprenyl-6-hydroxyphenyl methylase/3-demethylubiquinone-9 3-methyltransferase
VNDLSIYERHADDWWDERSRFAASLHALNQVRLSEIRSRLGAGFRGMAVDLGCGGGLIAERLARDGATVVGVDLSGASLRVARAHGAGVARLLYARGDALRAPLPAACADLVLCADVLEHVTDWRALLAEAARIARPGAQFYVNTISRTWRARAVVIWLGEGLGFVPRGTHDHRLFVRPDELGDAAAQRGWRLEGVLGQRVRPLATIAHWRLALAPTAAIWGTYSAWLSRTTAA